MDKADEIDQQLDSKKVEEQEQQQQGRQEVLDSSRLPSSNLNQSTMISTVVPIATDLRERRTSVSLSRMFHSPDPARQQLTATRSMMSARTQGRQGRSPSVSGELVIGSSSTTNPTQSGTRTSVQRTSNIKTNKINSRAGTSLNKSKVLPKSKTVFNTSTVPHPDYRDLAMYDPANTSLEQAIMPALERPVNSKGTFPVVLHSLLETVETSSYTDTIQWLPHGRSFVIMDKNRFEKEIIPVFFEGQKQYSSFHRQLNCYGFLRITRPGPDHNSFYHELFLRGRPDLAPYIPRQRLTTNSVRISLDPSTEPNFESLPAVGRSLLPFATTLPIASNQFVSAASSTNQYLPNTMGINPSDIGNCGILSSQSSFLSSRINTQANAEQMSLPSEPLDSRSPRRDNYLSFWPTERDDSKPPYVSASLKQRKISKEKIDKKISATDKRREKAPFQQYPKNSTNQSGRIVDSRTAAIESSQLTDRGLFTGNDSTLIQSPYHSDPTESHYDRNMASVFHSRLFDNQLQRARPLLHHQHVAQRPENFAYLPPLPSDRRISEERSNSHRALVSHLWQQQHSQYQDSQYGPAFEARSHFSGPSLETNVDRIVATTTSHMLSQPERLPMFERQRYSEGGNQEEQKQRPGDPRGDGGHDDGSILTIDSCSGMVDFLDDVDL
jgi:HSF-type DNA-binding